MLSGGVTGAICFSFTYPLEMARTRLAADVGTGTGREFKGMINCLSHITSVDGASGLYRGFGISVFGIVAYRALYFGLFDTGKALFFSDPNKSSMFSMWAFS